MDTSTVAAAATIVAAVDVWAAGRDELCTVLAEVARVEAWCVATRLSAASALAQVSATVEYEIGDAERSDDRDAARVLRRAVTAQAFPSIVAAMTAGEVPAWAIGELDRVRRSLPFAQRPSFDARAAEFLAWARTLRRRTFALALADAAEEIRTAAGEDRTTRQRRAVRCSTWTDGLTGMFRLSATFDPESGLGIERRLDELLRELMSDVGRFPDAPDDPTERIRFLRAHALRMLVMGEGSGVGAPEIVLVIDARAESCGPDGRPAIDTGSALTLDRHALRRVIERATIRTVEVSDNDPLGPDSERNLGRSSRTASHHQRRLLSAVHPTCVVPGCRVPFRSTDLHHALAWDLGGRTDLANLVPLCPRHHRLLHAYGLWLEVGLRRSVTVHSQDGSFRQWPAPSRGQPSPCGP